MSDTAGGARRADAGTGGLVLKGDRDKMYDVIEACHGLDVGDIEMWADDPDTYREPEHSQAVALLRALMDALIDEDSGMSVAEAVADAISAIDEDPYYADPSATGILRTIRGDTP